MKSLGLSLENNIVEIIIVVLNFMRRYAALVGRCDCVVVYVQL